MSFIRYGLEFPDGTNEITQHLKAYRFAPAHEIPAWVHLKTAAQLLFPERLADGRRGYVWSPWTERRFKAWCEIGNLEWQTWWGPSATGKTMDAALIILLHWLSAPEQTTIHVVSTDLKKLNLRIFGDIVRLHSLHGDALPGVYKSSVPCITLGDENSKNIIFGHAVNEGNKEKAMNKLVGIHNDFNVLVIDEMQGSLMAAVEASTNLSIGLEFKGLGMGNPQSRMDPLGIYSEPADGWESISTEMDEWKTKFGRTLFFNGLKSPGVTDPKRYPFLLKQSDIDHTRKVHGGESFMFWSQRIGFMPPDGMLPTVLTEGFIEKFRMRSKATWRRGWKMLFGLDPAYASGGDRCLLYPAKWGEMDDGKMAVEFQEPVRIEIPASKDKLPAYHIAGEVKRIMLSMGAAPEDLAMDCTGLQGAIADVIETEWGKGLLRVQFGGKPSTMQVDANSSDTADKLYKNRVTELWFSVRVFGYAGMVRGLSNETCVEFCQRLLSSAATPMQVESKKDMKLRTAGKSPDLADAASLVIALLRERFKIVPGGEKTAAQNYEDERVFLDNDLDGRDDLYLSPDV